MKKLILAIIITAALVLVGIYYFGFHNYFIENRVSEELPKMTPKTQEQVPNQAPQEPMLIKQGTFIDADFFHKGSGNAYIIEYPDGRKILRFENFETVNGPDLYVYLSKTSIPTGDLKSLGDYIDLGRLKGNIGDQNYELPKNISINDYSSAVIWCKKFGVLFPYAVLSDLN